MKTYYRFDRDYRIVDVGGEWDDFAIRNASICDGTGAPSYSGEIAVTDGLISEIGTQVGPAHENIDAGGQTFVR